MSLTANELISSRGGKRGPVDVAGEAGGYQESSGHVHEEPMMGRGKSEEEKTGRGKEMVLRMACKTFFPGEKGEKIQVLGKGGSQVEGSNAFGENKNDSWNQNMIKRASQQRCQEFFQNYQGIVPKDDHGGG